VQQRLAPASHTPTTAAAPPEPPLGGHSLLNQAKLTDSPPIVMRRFCSVPCTRSALARRMTVSGTMPKAICLRNI